MVKRRGGGASRLNSVSLRRCHDPRHTSSLARLGNASGGITPIRFPFFDIQIRARFHQNPMKETMKQSLLIAFTLVVVCGCGSKFKIAPVSGKVTLDGEPLGGALVSFEPLSQGSDMEAGYGSYGECDENGVFQLKSLHDENGAIVGPHRVLITTMKGSEGPNGEMIMTSKERVPDKYMDYNNPLKFEVPTEGTDQANFTLETGRVSGSGY